MLTAVNVQVRGCEVSPQIRAHFEEKLHGLEKLWSRLDDAQVRISHERGHYVAEVTLFSAGLINRAEERNHDLRAAFDAAVQKLQAQLKRYKDKVTQKNRRQNNRDDTNGVVLHPKSAPDLAAPATLAALSQTAIPVEAEKTAFEADGESSEGNEAPATLVRRKQFSIKPMSPDEATLQMDLLDHNFFVFRDCVNNQISVVYRRGGGGYGLIEPVAD
ncbi:putative sigma-54 modulation protein [Abditibacterium utsteinense]|uniref:Ribosome hibernation promoting factor n=1 Tax=Abditibacterium utsteinense TaxID=1960156 RepID=A0A2S8SW15_9BACT|nr:ribosome-associated translation inhibitor RaiA [Abditibacterium utsteinense]PQV64985.1 putative sigma-54 modulation protein [Abditibacterium utsteinense]